MTRHSSGRLSLKRLRELPLIWRFMLIPVVAVVLMVVLGLSLLDLRRNSIQQLETMRTEVQDHLETVVSLGSRLAESYSSIYQLLLDAPEAEGDGDIYRQARPVLNDLHVIEDALLGELARISADPEMKAEIDALVEALRRTRVASANALLMSTVDDGLSTGLANDVTRQFVEANRRFLSVEHLLHDSLYNRIADIVEQISDQTGTMLTELVVGFILAIGVKILSIMLLLRGIRRSIFDLSRLTNATAGRADDLGSVNEMTLLNRAIADARCSHERLEATGASLNESNAELQTNVVELKQAIEERDRAEHALSKAQRIEAVGKLTGGVAHDFNNLLAVVLGNLELLKVETREAEREKLIDAAVGATMRGADLTKNMLAFARRARLEPKVLDLNEIVLRTKNWAGRTLPATIEVETSLLAGLWRVRADESSTESALLNLIVNARDAMSNGGRLTIETANIRIDEEYVDERSEELEPGRYVMLAVSDTGTGMTPDVLEHIFDPFFTTKAPGAGSGLGLSMIEGFTRQSGGTVRVYSEPGVGTTFKLYFKALTGAVDREAPLPERAETVAKGGTRVLVVEDEAGVLEILVATLGRAGYIVRAARSGDEAMEKYLADPDVDILLTDIVMPGKLQGTTLARELRQMRPDLPVVFMSGYASEATVHGNGLRPEDIRMMKPVRSHDLLTAIEKALTSKRDGADRQD